ncbi:MAG: gliding motility-associated C-terminal domain-containing protein [Marinilabiliaceae bacterium]|nr:gliding motility-associated C-terminal domain-containing protein [Marinilabiliaceae bacterium]
MRHIKIRQLTVYIFLSLLTTLMTAQERDIPRVDSVRIVLDSLRCEGAYLHAIAYAVPYAVEDKSTGEVVMKNQKLLYQWYMSDTLALSSNYPEAELGAPYDTTFIKLVVTNQDEQTAVDEVRVPSYGVRASFTLQVREREWPHEITKGDALSAPANVEFSNTSRGQYTVSEWAMGSATRLFDKDPVYQFQETGDYVISLKVTNEVSGCWSVDSTHTVKVTDSDIDFPDVFTPNGDGVNDEFRPAYKSIKNYKLTVYNRWGRRIYTSTNLETGWDGKDGGTKAAEGVYMYICEADGYDKGVHFVKKGSVTLMR